MESRVPTFFLGYRNFFQWKKGCLLENRISSLGDRNVELLMLMFSLDELPHLHKVASLVLNGQVLLLPLVEVHSLLIGPVVKVYILSNRLRTLSVPIMHRIFLPEHPQPLAVFNRAVYYALLVLRQRELAVI